MAKRKSSKRTATASPNPIFIGLGLVLIVGAVILGVRQFREPAASPDTGLALSDLDSPLEMTSIETGRSQAAAVEPVAAAESGPLGPNNDPSTLKLAEAGQLGQPTLAFFHADWCTVCQRVRPEVLKLAEIYEGRVKVVQINIDYQESLSAVGRYQVRGTPTFVLFDATGQMRGQVPGWPGYDTLTAAFDQLLTEG